MSTNSAYKYKKTCFTWRELSLALLKCHAKCVNKAHGLVLPLPSMMYLLTTYNIYNKNMGKRKSDCKVAIRGGWRKTCQIWTYIAYVKNNTNKNEYTK